MKMQLRYIDYFSSFKMIIIYLVLYEIETSVITQTARMFQHSIQFDSNKFV